MNDKEFYNTQRKKLLLVYNYLQKRSSGEPLSDDNNIRHIMDLLIEIYTSLREKSDWGDWEDDLFPILQQDIIEDDRASKIYFGKLAKD